MGLADYTNWKRRDLDEEGAKPVPTRERAERETNDDLRKPIQQLICDVHEEVNAGRDLNENLAHAIKRMVSMMGRVALEHERSSRSLVCLTWVLTVLTVVIAALTIVLLAKAW